MDKNSFWKLIYSTLIVLVIFSGFLGWGFYGIKNDEAKRWKKRFYLGQEHEYEAMEMVKEYKERVRNLEYLEDLIDIAVDEGDFWQAYYHYRRIAEDCEKNK